jgi:hypothetical protein
LPRRLTTKEFIDRATKIHGNRYDYGDSVYRNAHATLTINCLEHGSFEQRANDHLNGAGCPECGISAKSLNTESFIKKAKKIHGTKYDYSKSRYAGYRTNLTIICPIHGEFEQMPVQHLARKRGCQKCAGSARSTTEEFITTSRLVHGDKYDYSHVRYKNNHTKVRIICPEHGVFEQIPMGHLKGYGCAACGGVLKGDTDSFIRKARKVHSDEYDYSHVNYVSAHLPVSIICQIHGEFMQKPSAHLNGARCFQCYGNPVETNESFIRKAQEIHGQRYDYSKIRYKNSQTKITIICPEHGEFKQKPNSHLNGRGCPDCAEFGFNPSKPAVVYYLRVANPAGGNLYKIGVTNTSVKKRFRPQDQPLITEIRTWKYKKGIDALTHESAVLKRFDQYRYKGPAILTNGNTEIFINDVLDLDPVLLNSSPS